MSGLPSGWFCGVRPIQIFRFPSAGYTCAILSRVSTSSNVHYFLARIYVVYTLFLSAVFTCLQFFSDVFGD